MDEGRIVRLGTIADEKLRARYNAYVTIDGIVERRSADLKARVRQIQAEIERIDRQAATAKAVLDQFLQLDNAQKNLDVHLDITNKLARSGQLLNAEVQLIVARLQELGNELEKRRKAIFGIFHRSEQEIQRDMSAAQVRRAQLPTEIGTAKARYAEAKAQFEIAKTERDHLHASLGDADRSFAERIIAVADKERDPFITELREIELKISELRASIAKEARVLVRPAPRHTWP